MSEMNADRLCLLELVSRFDDRANWYKLGRVALSRLSSPGVFTEELRWLIDTHHIEELPGEDGERLPRLCLTQSGRDVLRRSAGE